jgi:glycogen debranching enzyme
LPIAVLDGARARAVVDAVERELWTPTGLRSLARGDARYHAHYEGNGPARDHAYHNGTVWPWLLGAFVEAWVRVRGNTDAVRQEARARFYEPLVAQQQRAGLGHVAEITDPELPWTPRGCPFQAWSLAELLRIDRFVLGVH